VSVAASTESAGATVSVESVAVVSDVAGSLLGVHAIAIVAITIKVKIVLTMFFISFKEIWLHTGFVKRSPKQKGVFLWVTLEAYLYQTDFRNSVYYFDELIIAEIRKKSEVALKELYKTHFPMVVHLICSNSGTEQEAKDIFQEAVIAFYERVLQPDFVLTCKIKTYLYAVSRRLWLKRLNEKKRFHGHIEETESFLRVDEEMGTIEELELQYLKMNQAMEGLREPCLGIMKDFYVHNHSMETISTKYNYTNAENAKNQKYKCLQRLKKLFFAAP
jgi:RNA polymerase sigma factor (sigma-70 family)